MQTVTDILAGRRRAVVTIEPDATVYDALVTMAKEGIGALPVVERGRLSGILSERDYARNVILKGRRSRDTLVREVMTESPLTVEHATTIERCMQIMTDARVRHLPVLADERLVGIVSIGDIVKAIIEGQRFTIEQLEGYINGQAI